MGKFCTNCGNEVHEKAVICVKCGVPINDNTSKKGKSTASLTLGIIGLAFAVLVLIGTDNTELSLELAFMSMNEKIGFAIGYILIQATLGIIGLCLGLSDSKNNQPTNPKTKAGTVLSSITLGVCLIQFIIVMLN